MSHALAQTWMRRSGGALTRSAYEAAGGVRGAIARTAVELWNGLPAGQQRAVRAILTRLAVPGLAPVHAVRGVPTGDLTPAGDSDGETALRALVDARLVTLDSGTAAIAHTRPSSASGRAFGVARRRP